MSVSKVSGMNPGVYHRPTVVTAAILLFLTLTLASAKGIIVTQAALLDRIQNEDLLVKHYVDLISGDVHDLANTTPRMRSSMSME